MAEFHTPVGTIDTGDFTPTLEMMDGLTFDELEGLHDTLESEAINIEYQLEKFSEEKGKDWASKARFAMKMRLHNAGIINRYLQKQGDAAQRFMESAKAILTIDLYQDIILAT